MKETRVYIVVDDDERWLTCSDDEFMTQAEYEGSVWSLQGFVNTWNHNSMLIPCPDYSYIRIIDVKL